MKRLLTLFVAFAFAASAQFSGLSATGDGTSLYFSSHLRLRGSAESFDGKVFRTVGQSPVLFQSQTRGNPIGWTFENYYDLIAPQVSRDGSLIAYTGTRPCYGGSGCLGVQRAQGTLVDSRGETLVTATGFVNISPNAGYALFFGRNTFGGFAPPAELFAAGPGTHSTIPYPIGILARRRVADDGTVAIVNWPSVRLWKASGEQILAGVALAPASAPSYAEPLLLIGADARRLVYQSPNGLARYDRSSSAEEILTAAGPTTVAIDDNATVVAYIDPGDSQIHLAAPSRQLSHEPEGITDLTLSGDGRVAYAVTRLGRLLRVDVSSGAVTELVPRTASLTDAGITVSPGSLVSLAGLGLAASSDAAAPPLPRALAGVRVRIAGMDAAIQSVAPDVVWAQVPWELPEQQDARFEFICGDSPFETGPETVNVQTLAPHVYGYPENTVAVHQDWSGLITSESPAHAGEVITLYFSGLGPVSPDVATGEAAPSQNPARVTGPFRCQFWDGGPNDAQLYFAGLAPQMVGIYQVSVKVPEGLRMSPVGIVCDFGEGTSTSGGIGSLFVARP